MATRVLDIPSEVAYALVTAVRHHGRWIPLTRMSAPAGPLEVGDVVVARTAGVFLDRMRVVRADPPHLLTMVKTGPVLLGEVSIAVRPLGPRRAVVDWREDGVHLRGPLPHRWTARLLRPALEAMTALALWRIGRSVRRHRRRAA